VNFSCNDCNRELKISIYTYFGTANSGKEFSEITENNKSRKIKEFKSKAEAALWFAES
jgi:hypothetical protein